MNAPRIRRERAALSVTDNSPVRVDDDRNANVPVWFSIPPPRYLISWLKNRDPLQSATLVIALHVRQRPFRSEVFSLFWLRAAEASLWELDGFDRQLHDLYRIANRAADLNDLLCQYLVRGSFRSTRHRLCRARRARGMRQ
jgi:hypothetical protein